MTPRLLATVASMSARRLMSYRADFWLLTVFGFLAQIGIAYYLWGSIYQATGRGVIAGYTMQGMMLYYVLATLVGKIVQTTGGEGTFSTDIYDGSLSRYLVYPTNYFLFKFAGRAGETLPAVIQFAAFALVSWALIDVPDPVPITPARLLMFLASLAMAFTLVIAISCPIEAVAFWADNVWSLNVMVRFMIQLLGGSLLPLALFPGWARELLAWTPFPYIVSEPIRVLMGEAGALDWLRGVCIASTWLALCALATAIVWGRGYKGYTGVGM